VIREFVYDCGLTGGSNEALMEELYTELGLNEDEVIRRQTLKVRFSLPVARFNRRD
jgi:hypothetical protein